MESMPKKIVDYLEKHPEVKLGDLYYTIDKTGKGKITVKKHGISR